MKHDIRECLHCKQGFQPKRNGQICCCTDCFIAWCKSVSERKNNG